MSFKGRAIIQSATCFVCLGNVSDSVVPEILSMLLHCKCEIKASHPAVHKKEIDDQRSCCDFCFLLNQAFKIN
jgi:hypothetical protein